MLFERPNGALTDDVGVESLPSELEAVAEALRAAGHALTMSAYERFAAAFARIHDAADATQLARQRCDEARRSVEALLRQPPNAPSR
jgi:hypothetical protein